MSQIDDLPDYEEDEEPIGKKYKVDSMNSYKRPEILPHFIIVGHGQVRSYATFQNIYKCNINYFCTRGNVMLGYIDNRQYLIEQINKMCNKNIIVKEVLKSKNSYPAKNIGTEKKKPIWILDKDAAKLIIPTKR